MGKKLTKEEFIKRALKVHGNKYDYSKVNYINNSSKVCIICHEKDEFGNEHGEFWQQPNNHLNGNGCPKCKNRNSALRKLSNTDDFIIKAKRVHGDKYDYSKVKYVNNSTKVCIICPEHGEFWQTPSNHLQGFRCPECGKKINALKHSNTTSDFIEKARKVHGDKYDYSKVEYVNNSRKVCIICPIHGEFWQRPGNHLSGWGCNKCGYDRTSEKEKSTTEEFIRKSRKIHGDKYDYSLVDYSGNNIPVKIKCSLHGIFEQKPDKHLIGHGCPKCGQIEPKCENEIADFISNYFNVERRNRIIIAPKELDIYIREKNIAVEYNGLYWHTEEYGKGKRYHLDKLEACKKHGIKLIQIFEDEYVNHKNLVYEKLKHLIGIADNTKIKVSARNTRIQEITKDEAKEFLNTFHIQGFVSSTVYLGCYNDESLIGVMTFKCENRTNGGWELTRFATDYNYICRGVGGKLFKYFIRNYDATTVKSFADRRWTIDEFNNMYTKIGFVFEKYTNPDYRYFRSVDGVERQHKFGFRKQKLHKKYGLPLSMTEDEMTKELGYARIWDCGLIKYIWSRDNAAS